MVAQIKDNSLLDPTQIDALALMEKRLSYSGDNIEFIGYARTPDADTATLEWLIFKLIYDGDNLVRVQLPNQGPRFIYSWNDRATYF